MGINFNNNNFGKLTANNVKKNQMNFSNIDSQIQDALTKKVKVDLGSGTLGANQGTNFDSNNFGKDDGSQVLNKPAAKSWKKGLSDICKKIKESCSAQYQDGWKDQTWASGAAFAYLIAEAVDRMVSD